jgi:phage-related protein
MGIGMPWLVELYEDADGYCPVQAFLESLPVKDRNKLLYVIDLLAEFGTRLTMPHCKAIVGYKGLFELRSQFGNNIQRVFYVHLNAERFVLLHGFTKKTQKTPKGEITKAVTRWETLNA